MPDQEQGDAVRQLPDAAVLQDALPDLGVGVHTSDVHAGPRVPGADGGEGPLKFLRIPRCFFGWRREAQAGAQLLLYLIALHEAPHMRSQGSDHAQEAGQGLAFRVGRMLGAQYEDNTHAVVPQDRKHRIQRPEIVTALHRLHELPGHAHAEAHDAGIPEQADRLLPCILWHEGHSCFRAHESQ